MNGKLIYENEGKKYRLRNVRLKASDYIMLVLSPHIKDMLDIISIETESSIQATSAEAAMLYCKFQKFVKKESGKFQRLYTEEELSQFSNGETKEIELEEEKTKVS